MVLPPDGLRATDPHPVADPRVDKRPSKKQNIKKKRINDMKVTGPRLST